MKTTITGFIVLMMMSTSAFAWGGKRHKERGMGKVLKQLDLTTEQMDKLKTFKEENRKKKKDIRQNMKAAREEMKGAFKSNANESKLRSIHSKIQSYRNQMSDLRFEKLLKVRSILTAEQRAKFDELKAQMKEKRRGEKRMRREH